MQNLSKYSIQVAAFAVILALVILSTSYFVSKSKDKEQLKVLKHYKETLEKQEKYAKKRIEQLGDSIAFLNKVRKQDSTVIVKLEYLIVQDGVRLKADREKIKKLNSNEKLQWLTDRYSIKFN
jgi:predicted  nucleic acid-binding Zn-ribbon protein